MDTYTNPNQIQSSSAIDLLRSYHDVLGLSQTQIAGVIDLPECQPRLSVCLRTGKEPSERVAKALIASRHKLLKLMADRYGDQPERQLVFMKAAYEEAVRQLPVPPRKENRAVAEVRRLLRKEA